MRGQLFYSSERSQASLSLLCASTASVSLERDSERPVGLGREVLHGIIRHENVLSVSRLGHGSHGSIQIPWL